MVNIKYYLPKPSKYSCQDGKFVLKYIHILTAKKGDNKVPNIKSAKKRVLVIDKKTEVNKNNKSEVKTAIKKLNALIDAGNYDEAIKLYPETASIIDASVVKGVYHKNTAANKKSGLMKKINALKA